MLLCLCIQVPCYIRQWCVCGCKCVCTRSDQSKLTTSSFISFLKWLMYQSSLEMTHCHVSAINNTSDYQKDRNRHRKHLISTFNVIKTHLNNKKHALAPEIKHSVLIGFCGICLALCSRSWDTEEDETFFNVCELHMVL